jgi:four helix bundle protein
MFDFERLVVYQRAKQFHIQVLKIIERNSFGRIVNDQLSRASFSIVLNIAEGAGRDTKPAQRNFYVIARGSVFECVAVFDCLKDNQQITEPVFRKFYEDLDVLSKMLYGLITSRRK